MAETKKPKVSSLRLLVITPEIQPVQPGQTDILPIASETSKIAFSVFLKNLTGTEPSQDLESFAGYTSHPPLCLRNRYYSADIGIWCDELPPLSSDINDAIDQGFAEWVKNMQSEEAGEVRQVIGGIVLIVPYHPSLSRSAEIMSGMVSNYTQYINGINEVREVIEAECGRDIATIIAVQATTSTATADRQSTNEIASANIFAEKLEETCMTDFDIFGWDIVPWQPSPQHSEQQKQPAQHQDTVNSKPTTNEFGEKLDMHRIIEVLEQIDWMASVRTHDGNEEGYQLASAFDFNGLDDAFDNRGLVPKIDTFGKGSNSILNQSEEFQQEIMGLHFALQEANEQKDDTDSENGDELQVDQFMSLMSRAAEIRDTGSQMLPEDREKYARREVTKLMKDLNL